jgi:hypothetical protein
VDPGPRGGGGAIPAMGASARSCVGGSRSGFGTAVP